MTRKQKRILIILGVLDFIVIGALAAIVIRTMTSTPAMPSAVIRAQISPCVQTMLDTCDALPVPFQGAATVAWDAEQLYVTLSAAYLTETPPPESAQLLWTALDEMATVLREGCLVPETVIIALTVHGNVETVHYLAQFAGEDITAWIAGTLPEADLAAQSRFRQTSIAVDRADR